MSNPASDPIVTSDDNSNVRPPNFEVHKVLLAVIAILTTYLQLKYQEAKVMVAFIVAILVYGTALLLHISFVAQNSRYSDLRGNYTLLSGVLAIVLLLLRLVPIFGWIVFGAWVCWFVMVTYCFRGKLIELLQQTINKFKELIN